MVNLLKLYPLVGFGCTRYYNIQMRQWRELNNYRHACLCKTGFRRSMIPMFEKAVNSGQIYIDIVMWQLAEKQTTNSAVVIGKHEAFGMKGLPGRTGIGVGHAKERWLTGEGYNNISDPNFETLRSWIGNDVSEYIKLAQKAIAQNQSK